MFFCVAVAKVKLMAIVPVCEGEKGVGKAHHNALCSILRTRSRTPADALGVSWAAPLGEIFLSSQCRSFTSTLFKNHAC